MQGILIVLKCTDVIMIHYNDQYHRRSKEISCAGYKAV